MSRAATTSLVLCLVTGCSPPPSSTKMSDMSAVGPGSDASGSSSGDLARARDLANGTGNSDGGGAGTLLDVFRVLLEDTNFNNTGGGDLLIGYLRYSACTWSTIGPCTALQCPNSMPPPTKNPSAGMVSITGARVSWADGPDANGFYAFQTDNSGYAWKAGNTITYSAPGADLPMFSGSVTAPSIMTLTQPATVPAMIDRTTPWSLQWTPGPAGQVLRVTMNYGTASAVSAIDCALPLDAGHGVIPAAALQYLPAGTVTLSVEAVAKKVIAAGGIETWLIAGAFVYDGANKAFGGNVMLK
jgi:hypothetical protein